MFGYTITIKGEPPGLVMHNAEVMALQAKTRGIPKDEDYCEAATYRCEPTGRQKKGQLAVPAYAVTECVLKTASNVFTVRHQGKKTYVKRFLAGCGAFNPEMIPLFDLKGKPIFDYEIYHCPAVVDGKRIMRARPRIFPWVATFYIVFSEADPLYRQFAEGCEAIMPELIRNAGIQQGLLDNRPGSPKKVGRHGRFCLLDCELGEITTKFRIAS